MVTIMAHVSTTAMDGRVVGCECEGCRGCGLEGPLFFDPAMFGIFDEACERVDEIADEVANLVASAGAEMAYEMEGRFSGWAGDAAFSEVTATISAKGGWSSWWGGKSPVATNPDWLTFGFVSSPDSDHTDSHVVQANIDACPTTWDILSRIPGIRVAGFSRLKPRSHIKPHVGFTGLKYGSLAFHLGIIIPPDTAEADDPSTQQDPHDDDAWGGYPEIAPILAPVVDSPPSAFPAPVGLQVGHVVHRWSRKGQAIVFDDTYPHSAWSWSPSSDSDRIILYIDFKVDPFRLPIPLARILPSLITSSSSPSISAELGSASAELGSVELGSAEQGLAELGSAELGSAEQEGEVDDDGFCVFHPSFVDSASLSFDSDELAEYM